MNGQTEASNKVILKRLKRRLEDAKGIWVKELPFVLWAFKTIPCWSIEETPYSLAYGIKAVIPLEVSLPTFWAIQVKVRDNDAALDEVLDFAYEKKEATLIRLTNYQQSLSKKI